MIKKIFLGIVVIIVVGLVVAYFARNWIVKQAIEKGGDYALGVKTTVGSVNLGIGAGRLHLSDFEVHNPDGFQDKDIMSITSADLGVETGSIFGSEVVVDSLVLDGLTVDLEQIDRRSNFKIVLDHIEQVDMGSSSSGNQHFHIKRLILRNIGAKATLTVLGKKQVEQSYTVENITLHDVGGENGATIGQITAHVLKTVLSRAVLAAKGKLPGNFGDMFNEGVKENLQNLESEAKDKLKDLGKNLIGGGK